MTNTTEVSVTKEMQEVLVALGDNGWNSRDLPEPPLKALLKKGLITAEPVRVGEQTICLVSRTESGKLACEGSSTS